MSSDDPYTRAFEIAAGVLDVRDRTRAGHEVLPEDVLDVIVKEHPPEYNENQVALVMEAMADAGLLNKFNDHLSPRNMRFEVPGAEPGECEWCGAPFPEAIRHDVTDFGPDGEQLETAHICSTCISENY